VVASSLLGAAGALAAPAPTKAAAPVPVKAPAAKHITIKAQGTLRDVLKAIADKGGLNLVITGKLDQPGEIFLTDVSAEDALASGADSHDLKVRRQGSIWTIRPMTDEEREAKEDAAAPEDDAPDKDQAADADSDADDDDHEEATTASLPALPSLPTPPTPP